MNCTFTSLFRFFIFSNISVTPFFLVPITSSPAGLHLHFTFQIKSLLLSHHHSTSALVSEILMSVLQTVQKKKQQQQFTYGQTVQKKQQQQQQFTYGQTVQKNKQFTYGQTVQKNNNNNLHMDRQCKKQQTIYIWTDSAKKTTDNLHMDRQCKKAALEHLQCSRQCKKTTTIYIWTVHIYRLYRRQCAKYTYIYSVHIVYYKDTLNYQRHIIPHMGTSTLCTLSIHNVVYT